MKQFPPEIQKEIDAGHAIAVPVWKARFTWFHYSVIMAILCAISYLAFINYGTYAVLALLAASAVSLAFNVMLNQMVAKMGVEMAVQQALMSLINKQLSEAVGYELHGGTFEDEICLSKTDDDTVH